MTDGYSDHSVMALGEVRAYRLWIPRLSVPQDGGMADLYLHSTVQTFRWETSTVEGTCLVHRDEPAPGPPSCGSGIYGSHHPKYHPNGYAWGFTRISVNNGVCHLWEPSIWGCLGPIPAIPGVIAASGRMRLGDKGVRAQRARIQAMVFRRLTVPPLLREVTLRSPDKQPIVVATVHIGGYDHQVVMRRDCIPGMRRRVLQEHIHQQFLALEERFLARYPGIECYTSVPAMLSDFPPQEEAVANLRAVGDRG